LARTPSRRWVIKRTPHQGQECEFRYDEGGVINLNVTDLGQIELDGTGQFLTTDLPSFIVKKKAAQR
jgi:hypothetical protein